MIYSMRCETDPIRRPIDIDAIRRPIDLDEILLRENYLYWAAAYNPTFLFEIFNKKLCKSLIHQWQYTPLGEGEQKNIIQILGSHEDGKELLKKIISNEGEYQPLLRKQDALKACIQTSIAYEIVNDWSNGSSLYKQKNPDPTDNNEVDPHLGMGV